MARRKKETVYAPQSAAEATSMIAEFVELDRKAALERLAAEDAIDKVKAQRDTALREIEAEAKDLFSGLKAWWEAGGKDELAPGRRSAEIANAQIGIRLSRPALKFKRGVTAAKIVAWIGGLRLAGKAKYLRVPKTQLDKAAIIKELREQGPLADQLTEQGARVDQADEFFIDTGLDEDALKAEIAAS